MADDAAVKGAKKPAQKRAKTPRKTASFPKRLYALVAKEGKCAGVYDEFSEASDDAVGPRFRTFAIVEYTKSKTVYRHKEK